MARHSSSPSRIAVLLATALLSGSQPAAALNPGCAPGGNFNLGIWDLQLPIGSTGSPTTISSSQLSGCSGYENYNYFFTESGDGALVMKVPGSPASSGCVTTPNSLHCRTELRETSPSSWDPSAATNRMTVSLAVEQPDDSGHGTVVGQVHMDDSYSTKPVVELYYSSAGVIEAGVEQSKQGGDEKFTTIGTVKVGTPFSYTISYEGGVLAVSLNGGDAVTLGTGSLSSPPSYFKVGNYNQGDSASDVHFYSISVEH